jgi:hypothetical protein
VGCNPFLAISEQLHCPFRSPLKFTILAWTLDAGNLTDCPSDLFRIPTGRIMDDQSFHLPNLPLFALPVQSDDIRVFRIIPHHLVNAHAFEACYETAPMLVLDVVGTRDLSPQGLPKMIQ